MHRRHPVFAMMFALFALLSSAAAQTTYSLAGTFPQCSPAWITNCAATSLSPVASGHYQRTLSLPAGSFQFKIVQDSSWTVNYGANGVRNGQNMFLNLNAAASVLFDFDPVSHTTSTTLSQPSSTTSTTTLPQPSPATSTTTLPRPSPSPGSFIVVAGDFQHLVPGCVGDWDPSCSTTTMTSSDGINYSLSLTLPPGSYNFKVPVGGNWTINYGQNGARNGANIPVSVSPNTASVTFQWSASTKIPQALNIATPADLPGCQFYGATGIAIDRCTSDAQVDYDASYDQRKWQTPPRTSQFWTPGFQDYREIMAYSDIVYTDTTRTAAKVTVYAQSRTGIPLQYVFGSAQPQQSNSIIVTPSTAGGLTVQVIAPMISASITLDKLYFAWDNTPINGRPETQNGQKGAIVELFGWPYLDVAKECAFIAKAGYMGVKVWPPNEHLFSDFWLDNGNFNPWYWVYQPVSYRLQSRHGSLDDIRTMTTACRQVGVRVYADAVVNHMAGGANDVINHRNFTGGGCVNWGNKTGTAGSPFFTHTNTYQANRQTLQRPATEFPAVPWAPTDFHCERDLVVFNAFQMNYGYLASLFDLNTEKPYVQDRIATYMASLLNVGFSGFRVDAGRHISPDSNSLIFAKVAQKMGGALPDDFLTWLEVIVTGTADILACNDGPYNFYQNFNRLMAARGLSDTDINKIKIWSSDYPLNAPVCGSWLPGMPASRFVIQNDDHDQQSSDSQTRPMGNAGSVLVKDRNIPLHRQFEVALFNVRSGLNDSDDWHIRNVLSSYTWMDNGANGYPDGQSDCSKYRGQFGQFCKSVPFTPAFVADSCGYSLTDQSGNVVQNRYTRVHRDISIINAMRNWMGLPATNAVALGLPSNCS